MRLFAASLATETNTFSPIPTSLTNFEEAFVARPGEHPPEARLCTAPLAVARRRATQEGFSLVEGSCFWAEPSGTLRQDHYEAMRDEIMAQLADALPVDGVLLGLHGAMVAQETDDCEGDLIACVREMVGPDVPIAVECDPHCHLTEKRVCAADIMILFKEYPHIDFEARAQELVTLLLKTIRGEVRPVMSVYDCRSIAFFPTTREPTKGFVERMRALEREEGVLSVSLAHGFPHADVPNMGTRVLVVTDGHKARGIELAETLGREVIAMRERTAPPQITIETALDEAAAIAGDGPVIIAEAADNAGGGSASDNTMSLHALLARPGLVAAVGPVWDPQLVAFARAAGVGGQLDARIGGKTSRLSGSPVDAHATVVGLAENAVQTFGSATMPLGHVAALRIDERITVVAITQRTQALGREVFTSVGVDLSAQDVVVVKSAQHFYAAYAPIARGVLYAQTEGPSTQRYQDHDYRRVRRPLWPLDDVSEGALIV